MIEATRGPGRPPKAETEVPMKKGSSTWKPANVLDVIDKEPGYRYRVVEKSPRNVAKKHREGWETVSAIASPTTGNITGNYLDKGSPLTSVLEGYDYIVMRMPEEEAAKRDAYYNGVTQRSMNALTRRTKDDLSKTGAPIYGSITMEKKGIRNIIKE